MSADASAGSRLAYFPINLFGAVMGYAGLTLGFFQAHELLGIDYTAFLVLTALTTLFFILITLLYAIKLIRFPESVKEDFAHPVALHFFPTFSISLLLLSLLFEGINFQLAQTMWYLGTLLHFILVLVILNSWIHHEKWQITHMNPAWFIPVVGNIVIPLGAVEFSSIEIGWFFFSVGLIFWLVLFSIVMYRLFFHPPLLKLLEPTLFILIAPPAVGFLSYQELNGGVLDDFSRVLFNMALFMTILLFSQTLRFIRIPFALSWWAYSFPLAAIMLASFHFYALTDIALYGFIAAFLLAVLSALILHLTAKTFWAAKQGTLCHPLPGTKPLGTPPPAPASEK
ncbi:SLAC1 anion channel family protein [Thiomicrorhabdus heinhorstiae]|nr:SLAC1 anion channel family protein [Thiomicrorhabdus heinhorstiae]